VKNVSVEIGKQVWFKIPKKKARKSKTGNSLEYFGFKINWLLINNILSNYCNESGVIAAE